MLNKKKILIVGASSLVGNDLFLNLRKMFDITGTYYTYQNNFTKKNNFYQINLKSKKPFKNLENNIFHTVIWCINFNKKKSNFDNAFEINVLGLIKIMNFLNLKELKKLIFFSSGSIYQPSSFKIKENSRINLDDNYKITKYLGEKICEVYRKYFKFKLIIFRPFTIYGKKQKNKLIYNLINKIKKNKKIYIDGKFGIILSCISVDDVTKIVKHIILFFKKPKSVFNLSSPYSYSLYDFCNIISKKLNKNVKIVTNKNKVKNYVSDSNKLMKKFKFINFENYIERII